MENTASMREPERLAVLERVIGEAMLCSEDHHHYQRDDVLARYRAALAPQLSEQHDVAALAATDLDTWEQRHEPRYDRDASDGHILTPDLQHTILRLEAGWRVYPTGMARRADAQSHMRQETHEHIAYLEQRLREALVLGIADTPEPQETEQELHRARRYLLSPSLQPDYPYTRDEQRRVDAVYDADE
jgi:hypothetical protein